ncbi:MAG: tetratricopeptide repeat protein [Chitinophagaceae bacterium]|nr:tetratricopeptide repeat protein [Chitinophagaceae bacterium]
MLNIFNQGNSSSIDKIRQLNVLAGVYNKLNIDSTLLFATQALQHAKALKDVKGEADALMNLASYYELKPDYTKGLELGLLCTNKYNSINDKKGLAQISIEIAMLYKKIGAERLTEEYIQLGLDYSKRGYNYAAAAADTLLMIFALNQAGIIFRDWGKKDGREFYYDSAFNCYTKALSLVSATAGEETLGRLYNNISQVYTEYKNNPAKGLEYLLKAVDFNRQNNRLNSLSYNYGNISNVYISLGDKKKALEYAYKTLAIAQQMNLPDRLLNAYSQLSKAYEFDARFDSALYYFKRTTDIRDSLLNIEKTKQIADAQEKYEAVKKESRINLLDTANKAKAKNIYFLSFGLLIMAILVAAMALLYKRVTKQKLLLAEQSAKLELMMKELHHRVKNKLQIVSSLLSLQSYRMHDAEAVAAMNESRQRVQAMSLIHQRLYKTDMLTAVNIKEYITDLTSSLMAAYGYNADDFELQLTIEKELLDVEKALPIGLILNEVITNAFKYAYKDIAAPSLQIVLNENSGNIQLTVKDNGIGINTENWNKKSVSFGKQLISSLCKQLRAQQQVTSESGTALTFIIPVKAA